MAMYIVFFFNIYILWLAGNIVIIILLKLDYVY